MQYEFIYFDVAGTILYKYGLYEKIKTTLNKFNFNIDKDTIIQRHKMLLEMKPLPQKTTRKFYDIFNSELLYSLGIVPQKEIIKAIFESCSDLPWKKFKDSEILGKFEGRMGIISNWDSTLRTKLESIFNFKFNNIVVSSEEEVSKPNLKIYKSAILKSKVPVEKILYVGDSIKLDIEPALKLGMQAVLIDRYNIFPFFKGIRIKSLSEIKGILNS